MDAWFDSQTASIIERVMGGAIGIWGGCVLGGMSWFYVNKGLKKLAYFLYGSTIFIGLVILGIGIAGLFQPLKDHGQRFIGVDENSAHAYPLATQTIRMRRRPAPARCASIRWRPPRNRPAWRLRARCG